MTYAMRNIISFKKETVIYVAFLNDKIIRNHKTLFDHGGEVHLFFFSLKAAIQNYYLGPVLNSHFNINLFQNINFSRAIKIGVYDFCEAK